jgi:transcriptional regulator with XRE-family HTH domain
MFDPAVADSPERGQRTQPLLRRALGRVLRRIRLRQGRTLADVARAARISMPYLSELERGRKEASSEILAAICDALHVELSDLLADVGTDLANVAADLAVGQARHTQIVRLGVIGDSGIRRQPPGSGDVVCLLAA